MPINDDRPGLTPETSDTPTGPWIVRILLVFVTITVTFIISTVLVATFFGLGETSHLIRFGLLISVVSGCGAVIAINWRSQRKQRSTQGLPTIPIKALALMALLVAAVGVIVTMLGLYTTSTVWLSREERSEVGTAILTQGLAASAALAGIFALYYAAWRQRATRVHSHPLSVKHNDRVEQIRSHMSATRALLVELQDDLATQTRLLEERQAEADRYGKLATFNADQAKAIEDLVGRQFRRQQKSAITYWWVGVAIAFLLGLVVNWVSAPLLTWLF